MQSVAELASGGARGSERQGDLATEAAACRSEQGMAAALALLDERMRSLKEPRERFYAELVLADLLAEDGMKALAAQHYQRLWQESQQLGLMQWEPGMVDRLQRLAASRKNKTFGVNGHLCLKQSLPFCGSSCRSETFLAAAGRDTVGGGAGAGLVAGAAVDAWRSASVA